MDKQEYIGKSLEKKLKNCKLPYGMQYISLLASLTDKAEKLWNKQNKMDKTIFGNWGIKTFPHDGKGINPCLHNQDLDMTIKIPNKSLNVFGYRVAGCELGIIKSDSEGTKEDKINEVIKIMSEIIKKERDTPTFFDIRKYLRKYKGKRRLGVYITPSKQTTIAINKVLEIIENDWQEINNEAKLERSEDLYI